MGAINLIYKHLTKVLISVLNTSSELIKFQQLPSVSLSCTQDSHMKTRYYCG